MERTAETTGGDAAYPEVKLVEAAAAGLLACGPEHVLEFKETLSRLSASVSSLGTGVSSLGTGGSRRAYILHAFPLWSAVLLARVAPQLNIFDRREKEALFDAFFKNIPAPFSVQALCSWLVQTPLPALEQHIHQSPRPQVFYRVKMLGMRRPPGSSQSCSARRDSVHTSRRLLGPTPHPRKIPWMFSCGAREP